MEQAGITLVQGIMYLLPLGAIGGLIWKAAVLSSKVKQHEEDILEIKAQVSQQSEKIINSLEKLNDTMQKIRTDVEVLKVWRGIEVREETK